MSWVMVGMAVAGAVMANEKQKKAEQIEDADTKLQADLTRYSWVDGAQKGNPGAIRKAGDAMSTIGQGALGGAMFGSQFGKGTPSSSGGVVAQNQANGGQLYTGTQDNNSWEEMLRQQNQDQARKSYV